MALGPLVWGDKIGALYVKRLQSLGQLELNTVTEYSARGCGCDVTKKYSKTIKDCQVLDKLIITTS